MKFAVGEIALVAKAGARWDGKRVVIYRVGPFKIGDPDPDCQHFPVMIDHDYVIHLEGGSTEEVRAVLESWLLKLPGDDASRSADSEDPALTRLKKLLKQDQPKPVRVHG